MTSSRIEAAQMDPKNLDTAALSEGDIQLSKKTVDILRNYSNINKSILINPGKFVQTMSVNKNIIAMGQIAENIPEQMAIYDLPLFLGMLMINDISPDESLLNTLKLF